VSERYRGYALKPADQHERKKGHGFGAAFVIDLGHSS
jgi:hypothetical protein